MKLFSATLLIALTATAGSAFAGGCYSPTYSYSNAYSSYGYAPYYSSRYYSHYNNAYYGRDGRYLGYGYRDYGFDYGDDYTTYSPYPHHDYGPVAPHHKESHKKAPQKHEQKVEPLK